MRSRLFLVSCALLAAVAARAQVAGPKVALVIGNGSYAATPLKNPPNDAKDVAAALGRLGFAVTNLLDADQKQMKRAIDDFGDRCKGASVALFYYSGHGVQVNGENWLIPVKSEIQDARDVEYEGVQLGRVLGAMEGAGAGTNVLILDACRNNPFPGAERSAARGLAVVGRKPPESVIVYSTEAGETAADGAGRNGTFTEAFLRNIEKAELSLNGVLMAVNAEVRKATDNRQRPARYDNLTRDVYLSPAFAKPPVQGGGAAPASAPAQPAAPVVKKPSLIVERSYGSVRIETKAPGVLYLGGEALGDISPGAEALLNDIEVGNVALEMRYADGTVERVGVTVAKNAASLASFSQGPRPGDPRVPRSGLVAEWLFDGDARDTGGGGLNGVVTGAKPTEDRFGRAGKAYKFEGSDYIKVASAPALNFGKGAFTVAFWLKTSGDCGNSSDDYFISKYRDDKTHGWSIKEREAGLALLTNEADWDQTFADRKINDGGWRFMVVTRKADGQKLVYVDSAKVLDYKAASHDVSNDQELLFGRDAMDNWNAKCSLDDVRFYNRALSEAEIEALFRENGWSGKAGAPAVPRSGLVAEYLFNGDAKDSGGSGLDGTVVGAKPAANRFGKSGMALQFDGKELVKVPSKPALNFGKGDFSVSFWIKTEGDCGSGSHDYFVAKYTTDSGNGWSIKESEGAIGLLTTSGTWDQKFQDKKINDGKWRHIVAVRRSDGHKSVYCDGERTLDYDIAVNDVSNDTDLVFGRNEPYNSYAKCLLDDVRIYNRVLSQDEVKVLFAEGGWTGK